MFEWKGSREYNNVPSWLRISGDNQGIGGRKTGGVKQKQGDFVVSEYPDIGSAAIATCTSYEGIRRCLKGEQKTSGGFVWSY
ncbi:MAG: hypothetical protein PHQ35_11465 [Phycisphaerae bacterium]|nr:hypothetical protein [Phycisphaerae bacterium]